jgi:dTDP-4-dehydrorhamnose 3,5-epimerase
VGEVLSAENFRQLYVPPGFAHGFYVMSESAHVLYKCTTFYDREDEVALLWNDPQIGIVWPTGTPLLSPRDQAAPTLAEIMHKLAPQ